MGRGEDGTSVQGFISFRRRLHDLGRWKRVLCSARIPTRRGLGRPGLAAGSRCRRFASGPRAGPGASAAGVVPSPGLSVPWGCPSLKERSWRWRRLHRSRDTADPRRGAASYPAQAAGQRKAKAASHPRGPLSSRVPRPLPAALPAPLPPCPPAPAPPLGPPTSLTWRRGGVSESGSAFGPRP